MLAPEQRETATRSLLAFFLLALAVSWGAWTIWIFHGRAGRWDYLHLAGSVGPCVSALLVTRVTAGTRGLRRLLGGPGTRRAIGVALGWGLLFPVALFVGCALVLGAASHVALRWERVGVTAEYPALGPGAYVVASFVCYGLGEEIGWRGFVYPALRRTHTPLAAALSVVPLWAFWHAPLFVIAPGFQTMGVGAVVGWLLSLASGSVLTAWLRDRARGSVLPAAVLHATLDVLFVADVGVPVQSLLGAAVTVWGVAVARALSRRPDR